MVKRYFAKFDDLEDLIRAAIFTGAFNADKKLPDESYVGFANRLIPEFLKMSATFRGLSEVPEWATHFAHVVVDNDNDGQFWYLLNKSQEIPR